MVSVRSSSAPTATAKTSTIEARNASTAEAKAEIARLQKKTEMLLTRTVELQDELLNVHKAEKAEREKRAEKSSAEESVGRAAHTGHTAARS